MDRAARTARYRRSEAALWASVGAAPEERTVRLATGTAVRVLDVGDGEPLLFVHGATNGASSWAPLVARLTGRRCLLLDRPGCGLSEPSGRRLASAAELAAFADRLVADVLDGLGVERAALVGTSLGGYHVLRTAAAHPQRVAAVVELSWPVGAPIERVAPAMRLAGIRPLGLAMAHVPPSRAAVRMLLRQIGLRHALDEGAFDDVALDWYRALLRDTPTMRHELDAAPAVVHPLRGLDEGLLLGDDVLGRITAPVHFVWGAQDPQGGEAVGRAFAARIPGATIEVEPDAGHAPWMDDPARCAASVLTFLARAG